jgi:hypothetical protein
MAEGGGRAARPAIPGHASRSTLRHSNTPAGPCRARRRQRRRGSMRRSLRSPHPVAYSCRPRRRVLPASVWPAAGFVPQYRGPRGATPGGGSGGGPSFPAPVRPRARFIPQGRGPRGETPGGGGRGPSFPAPVWPRARFIPQGGGPRGETPFGPGPATSPCRRDRGLLAQAGGACGEMSGSTMASSPVALAGRFEGRKADGASLSNWRRPGVWEI